MFFRKKKNEESITTYPYGYLAAMQPTTQLSQRALICMLKGFIIFAAAFGTIGGVITSFSLPCHIVVIFFGLMLLSLLLAFLHYNRWIFNLGYPVLFFLFVFFIITFRYQVNSGYQAFLSIMQEQYSTYFNLSILRQAQETIQDRTLTITYASLFIGFFLLILLNIAVSEYMSLIFVFLLTFPIFQLGIYIDSMPNIGFLILLLSSYFMVGTLKRSEHYLLPYHDKKFTEFKYKKKKNVIIHRYHASGKVFLQMNLQFFIYAIIVVLISLPMLLNAHASSDVSYIRNIADKYVQNLTQSGLSSFFDRYQATGGLSEGKLGGVSAVRPDYQTDLSVTFVPYAYETLYLKGFTGGDYSGNKWERPTFDTDKISDTLGDKFDAFPLFTTFLESRRLQNYMKTHKDIGLYAKMKVENIDANINCLYLPYYTSQEIDTEYNTYQSFATGVAPVGGSYTLHYYPLLHDYWPVNQAPDGLKDYYGSNHIYAKYIDQYDWFCYENYRSIPNEVNAYLQTLHEDIGISHTVDEQILMVQNFLAKNYKYDMQPGSTPYRQDFVQYFLETQKKGYCAHFASAATLLLRSYDIPARYVEGYAISFREMSEGFQAMEKYSDWFEGDNPIGQSGVITVNVTDADAHAWVEIYRPGIGWVPYDFTPPADYTDETTYSEFWSIFSSLMRSQTQNDANNMDLENAVTQNHNVTRVGNTFLLPFFIFISCLLLAIGIVWILRKIIRVLDLQSAYAKGTYVKVFEYRYTRIVQLLNSKGLLHSSVLLPTELAALTDTKIATLLPEKERLKLPGIEEIKNQMAILEICCYSPNPITKSQADHLLLFLTKYEKQIKKIKQKKEKEDAS